jgi:hypothetical protein
MPGAHSEQAPWTLIAPVRRVFGAVGAHNAGLASLAAVVTPRSPLNYPSDGYGGHDRAGIEPQSLAGAE